jgi:RNA polymerase sigma-70 factor (ECF subfamily)
MEDPSNSRSKTSIEELMAAYQNGDKEAANALIECVSPALYRFFALHSGDRRHADDLLQETWIRIHKARHTYRPGEPLLPWLYAIARYVKIDAYRKRRHERYEEPLKKASEQSLAAADNKNKLPDLDTLLQHLPASQREVIVMLKISGLSLEEAARATSCSVGSVKQKAHRAYEKMRTLFAGLDDSTRQVEPT